MANTLTNMQGRIMADAAVLEVNSILSNLTGISIGLNKEAGQKGDNVRVPVISTVEADDFDATTNNYAAGDHTDEGVDIPVNRHKVAKCKYTDKELAEAPVKYWEAKGKQCAKGVAKAVVKDVFGLINGVFTKKADIKLAEFTTAYIANLVTTCEEQNIDPAEATLTLKGTFFSKLLAELTAEKFGGSEAIRNGVIPGLFGFKQIVRAPLLASANAALAGFISLPQAIGLGFRYLQPDSVKCYEEVGQAYDDATGILMGIRRFGEAATGTNHLAMEALYGAKAVDKNALLRLLAV